jgi:hypothetical protein
MAIGDSAWLRSAFLREAGLQDANEMDDTAELYPRLSVSQQEVQQAIASRYPECLYPAPFALTPSGDHKTFTFGTDTDGNAIVPLGWVQISPSKTAFTGDRFVGWEANVDFIDEGASIRIVSDRSYSGTLWCRAVLTPPDITSGVAPVLNPILARQLIAIYAARDYALEGNENARLANAMQAKIDRKFPELMLALRRRYRGGGAMIDPARWYLSAPDLGTTS